MNLEDRFEAVNDEFLKFENIESPRHPRPDMCAFLTLDGIIPGATRDMVCAAEHDQIYLDVDCDELEKVITNEDVLTLVRCGVMFDSGTDSLSMFA